MAKKKQGKKKPAAKKPAAVAPAAAQAPITKTAALKFLRAVETQLYAKKTEAAVLKLNDNDKTLDFIGARLAFTSLIARLNKQLMENIGADLRAQAPALKKGIEGMSESLTKLEDAAKWAKAINTVTSSIGKVVGFFG